MTRIPNGVQNGAQLIRTRKAIQNNGIKDTRELAEAGHMIIGLAVDNAPYQLNNLFTGLGKERVDQHNHANHRQREQGTHQELCIPNHAKTNENDLDEWRRNHDDKRP
jgi:hypothetical protein